MSRLAVILWYQEEQNEPSKPESDLVRLSDDPAERDKVLTAMFRSGYDEEREEGDTEAVEIGEAHCHFGDVQASCGGIHMFATYVKLPEDEETTFTPAGETE